MIKFQELHKEEIYKGKKESRLRRNSTLLWFVNENIDTVTFQNITNKNLL